MNIEKKQWLLWVRELQAIAQIGRTFCKDVFCQERYKRLNEIAAEIADQYVLEKFDTICELFSKEAGYTTPKIDVRAVVIKNDKVLLVQEADDKQWSLPGGWADVNTSPSESAIREVFEESGYIVKVNKLAAFYDKHKHNHPIQWPHAYKAFFLCDLIGGDARVSHETLAIDFFPEDELPPLSLDRVTKEEIYHLFEHAKHPELPTDFD